MWKGSDAWLSYGAEEHMLVRACLSGQQAVDALNDVVSLTNDCRELSIGLNIFCWSPLLILCRLVRYFEGRESSALPVAVAATRTAASYMQLDPIANRRRCLCDLGTVAHSGNLGGRGWENIACFSIWSTGRCLSQRISCFRFNSVLRAAASDRIVRSARQPGGTASPAFPYRAYSRFHFSNVIIIINNNNSCRQNS